MVADWGPLDAELEAWRAVGRRPRLWWRDDDAIAPTGALDRLIGATEAAGVALALAVVPALATASLARRLRGVPRVTVLQHGWTHANHRPPGARAAEFGGDRPRAEETAELRRGQAQLAAMFGAQFTPIFVPPWNRLDPGLVPALVEQAFSGLSMFGESPAAAPRALRRIDAGLDLVAWRDRRRFIGAAPAIARLADGLARRRSGGGARPFGLLTHHLVHDAALWSFLDALMARLSRAGAAWISAAQALALADPPELFGDQGGESGGDGSGEESRPCDQI